jgi:FkbM family methyltransferase
MTLDCAAAHTVRPDLFTGGWVLDAGCRDFIFTQYAVDHGCRVIALDPDPAVSDPQLPAVAFVQAAISTEPGQCDFALTDDVEARHIASANSSRRTCRYIPVRVTTIRELMAQFGIAAWDCVKMDIEGSEYGILSAWPGPIAKQITVEFHDHVEKRPPELYERICGHLGQWYRPVKWYAGDTLFVLKELVAEDVIGAPWWRK